MNKVMIEMKGKPSMNHERPCIMRHDGGGEVSKGGEKGSQVCGKNRETRQPKEPKQTRAKGRGVQNVTYSRGGAEEKRD